MVSVIGSPADATPPSMLSRPVLGSECQRRNDFAPMREGVTADHATEAAFAASERSAFGAERSPLVTRDKSQKHLEETIELCHQTIRVKRPFNGKIPETPDRTGLELQGFSDKSRGRLRFTAAIAGHYLISQFCLTYHNLWPIDGREFNRQTNLFLTRVRRQFKGIRYLWVGEFQRRGCPHLHFYSSIPVSPENKRVGVAAPI